MKQDKEFLEFRFSSSLGHWREMKRNSSIYTNKEVMR